MAKLSRIGLALALGCGACTEVPSFVSRDGQGGDQSAPTNDGSESPRDVASMPDAVAMMDAAMDVTDAGSAPDVSDASSAMDAMDAARASDAAADAADSSSCPTIVGDDGTGVFPPTCTCIPNTTRACSIGPRDTAGVGACRRGVQRCVGSGELGRWSATCEGAIGPVAEACGNRADDDCDGMIDEDCGCAVGSMMSCYPGPAGTAGVGACRNGSSTCAAGADGGPATFGACTGAVVPRAEVCGNMVDDDCNGMVDNGCGCTVGATMSCYTGPAGTAGVGACRAGTSTCMAGVGGAPATFGACTGQVVPRAEVCGNMVDDSCNGMVDEGCATMAPACTLAVENAAGRYIVLANYDGGRAVVDVDRAIDFVGVIAYEPVEIVFTGAFASSIRRVHIVGYNSATAVVSGVAAAIVERAGMPAATLMDADGWPRMVCAVGCRAGSAGGCNTHTQVNDYFATVFAGSARLWRFVQYGRFTGLSFVVSRGGCCIG